MMITSDGSTQNWSWLDDAQNILSSCLSLTEDHPMHDELINKDAIEIRVI